LTVEVDSSAKLSYYIDGSTSFHIKNGSTLTIVASSSCQLSSLSYSWTFVPTSGVKTTPPNSNTKELVIEPKSLAAPFTYKYTASVTADGETLSKTIDLEVK
jgi:hypothetical protein